MVLNKTLTVVANRFIILIATTFLLVSNAFSQVQNGKISGTVYDDENNPVKEAIVSIDRLSLTTRTDEKGTFLFSDIVPNTYAISVSADGYDTKSQSVSVNPNEETIVEIRLQQSSTILETLTITAEKRETILQKTPVSVSVLNAQKVEDYRLWSLSDLSAVVPNLFIPNGGSDFPFYSIRGMYSNSIDQSVAVYIDGVMQYDAESTMRNLYDIERMEVLRGPQGTLYGRNAMAGVINIITKKPGNVTSGYADISFANYGTQRYTAGIKTPLVDNKLFAGLSASYNKTNGYYTNLYDNQKFDKNHAVEGSFNLRYLPSDSWALSLNAKAQKTFNHGKFPFVANDSIALADGYVTDQNTKGVQERVLYSASLSAQHYAKWFDIISITSYQYADKFIRDGFWDGDWSAYDLFQIGYGGKPKDNSYRTFTQEIRLNSSNSNSDKFRWTAGAFYLYHPEVETALLGAGDDAMTMLNDPYAPYILSTPSEIKNEGYAFFGQATYTPIPKLSFTAGLRYDRETKNMYTRTTMIKEGFPDMELVERTRIDGKYKAISPKFNVAYQLNEEMMVYANYSRGFKAGGLNKRTTDPDFFAFNPEFSDNLEISYKAGWLNRKLITNLTLFYTDWKDMQVTAFTRSPGETAIRNTGNGKIKGIEVEILTVPVKGLSIDYNFSYNHGRYTQLTQPNVATGTEEDLKGNWLIMQPEFTSMLAAQYSHNLTTKIKGMIRGEWSFLGKHYFNIENTAVQNPYSLFNAKAGLAYNKIELQFWARNIFNERYLSFIYPTGAKYAMLGFPATFGTSLITKF